MSATGLYGATDNPFADTGQAGLTPAAPTADEATLVRILRGLDLVEAGETPRFRPLAGGVSSDILDVVAGHRRFCVKRALRRLKVAAVWEVPIERNAAEAAWMREVAAWVPGAVPAILGEDRAAGLFAMDYLPPEAFPVWKTELLDGAADAPFGAAVGRTLGRIHRASVGRDDLAARFAHDATFHAIRIEPYLLATAHAHADLRPRLEALADRTARIRRVLVHGDVSPKNILHGPDGPVFLDAECAVYGDPAFDLAFCLNHLLLKGAHRRDRREAYLAVFRALADAYLAEVDWEPRVEVDARAAALLPALLLARVDGKSPVEYLGDADRAAVRQAGRALMLLDSTSLEQVAHRWSTHA